MKDIWWLWWSLYHHHYHRCVGRRCTWGSSPRASFAPQGATGSTATPATRVKILIKMRFLPGSHRSETYSGGSDVLSQTERKNENYYGFCWLLSVSWVIMGSVWITVYHDLPGLPQSRGWEAHRTQNHKSRCCIWKEKVLKAKKKKWWLQIIHLNSVEASWHTRPKKVSHET